MHEKWLIDYNHQRHMAHEAREDNCHSPAAVLGWVKGMQAETERIYRAFSAIGEARVLNKAGYAKFRNFLLYGEQGLVRHSLTSFKIRLRLNTKTILSPSTLLNGNPMIDISCVSAIRVCINIPTKHHSYRCGKWAKLSGM